MPNWIEDELSCHLRPVKAPESLWQKIAQQGTRAGRPRRREYRWVLWPAVAGLVLLASSEIRYHAERPTVSPAASVSAPALAVRAAAVKTGHETCLQCHTEKM